MINANILFIYIYLFIYLFVYLFICLFILFINIMCLFDCLKKNIHIIINYYNFNFQFLKKKFFFYKYI